MNELSRRRFFRLALGGAAISALSGCASAERAQGTTPPAIPQGPTTTATPPQPTNSAPAPTASPAILRGGNVPGFYVRYYRPFEAVDPDRWTLSVEGLVRNPQKLSLSNLLALPRRSQVSRMKCVECWSAAAKWEGTHLSTLMELAHPTSEARWVHFHCADGYYESMGIEALLRDRVLFVHHMNDEILPDIYGAPLRLMVPFLYGYKSAKAIVRLEFAREELPGIWPDNGPYTTHGTIRAGRDNPLDLEGTRPIPGGSEIFYPEGIESQDQ